MIPRVYIDTSVIGGCYDPEFAEWSRALWNEFVQGKKIALISDNTQDELVKAPQRVRGLIAEIPNEHIIECNMDDAAKALAQEYRAADIVGEKHWRDTLHIAMATLKGAHVLASWNFKHIVNLEKIRRYNAVNLKLGHRMIEIRTPREILSPDET